MRTILMALVLGLLCTNFAFAQPEVSKTATAPPAPPTLESVVQDATPAPVVAAPAPAVVVEQAAAAPVCVNGQCRIQPIRTLVVKPIANVMGNTVERVQQVRCNVRQRTQCRVQRVRVRLFQRRCCR